MVADWPDGWGCRFFGHAPSQTGARTFGALFTTLAIPSVWREGFQDGDNLLDRGGNFMAGEGCATRLPMKTSRPSETKRSARPWCGTVRCWRTPVPSSWLGRHCCASPPASSWRLRSSSSKSTSGLASCSVVIWPLNRAWRTTRT